MSIQGKTIHYVIAAYLGRRRAEYAPQIFDRMLFLRYHLASLKALKHSLDRITIVVQIDALADVEQVDAIHEAIAELLIASPIRSIVRTMTRPNDYGVSYTALAHVVARTHNAFDYTIFNEDDYIFTQDNFDRYLVHKLEAHPAASYLAGCERVYPFDGISHAAVCTSARASRSRRT